jgi:hypothetical protein
MFKISLNHVHMNKHSFAYKLRCIAHKQIRKPLYKMNITNYNINFKYMSPHIYLSIWIDSPQIQICSPCTWVSMYGVQIFYLLNTPIHNTNTCGTWNGTSLFKIFMVKLVHISTNISSSFPIFVNGFHINKTRMINV